MYNGYFFFNILLYLLFWGSIITLVMWLYRQFANKPGASLLAWGLSILVIISAFWCASVWFNGNWRNSMMFGGWSGNGMMSTINGEQFTVQQMDQLHNTMMSALEANATTK